MAVDPLTIRQWRDATEVCVRAFTDYPFLAALFPGDPERRAPVARAFYGATLRDCLVHGRTDAVTVDGQVAGVAGWLPPGAHPVPPSRLRVFLPVVGAVLRRYPHRAVKGVQALARLERHHMREAHWYLAVVAVDPPHQRSGIGGRLLRPVLDLADERGEPCFLETADPDNVGWYPRFGFETTLTDACFPGGPPQWFMRRAPQP